MKNGSVGAYLVARLVADERGIRVASAGIYSEEYPTQALPSEHTVCLLSESGDTFEEAVRRLKKEAKIRSVADKVIAWAIKDVTKREEARGF